MDAAAARQMSAMVDRDVADLAVKVDANRKAINALGEQTRERFDAVDRRFADVDRRFEVLEQKVDDGFAEMRGRFRQVDDGFAEMRAKLDGTAAGLAHIVSLVTTVIEQQGPETR